MARPRGGELCLRLSAHIPLVRSALGEYFILGRLLSTSCTAVLSGNWVWGRRLMIGCKYCAINGAMLDSNWTHILILIRAQLAELTLLLFIIKVKRSTYL